MTARKFSARGVAVAAIVSVGLLSGCTATGWVAEAPPAAGVQAQTEALQKARNLMFVVDDSGEGVLLGAITSVDPTQVTGIRYDRIDGAGLHVSSEEGADPALIEADTVVLCAGQVSERSLADALEAAGREVHVIGGADVAAELDAKRAIDQGTRLAATL